MLFGANIGGLLLSCAFVELCVVIEKRIIKARHLTFLPQGTTWFLDWHYVLLAVPALLIIVQLRAMVRGQYSGQGVWAIVGGVYFTILYVLIAAIAFLLPWALP